MKKISTRRPLHLVYTLVVFFFLVHFTSTDVFAAKKCGEIVVKDPFGNCPAECPPVLFDVANSSYCCGVVQEAGLCIDPNNPDPNPNPNPNPNPPVPNEDLVTGKFLYDIDPLNPVNSGNSTNKLDGLFQDIRFRLFQSPGGILSLLLPLLFTIAGLIVFVMVVWGGFEMLMSATSSKAQEAGKQRITAAIIGFVLLFISYWLAQIIQMIFGVRIL